MSDTENNNTTINDGCESIRVSHYQYVLEQYINEYIESLDETEKLVLEIAKDHLESSFCIERSVGFVKWLKDNSKTVDY